ncbi:MAG: bifunctional phosphopantothenoylcysteine decarboxylase/phosphopantothenate--cysteine ligase CoaBC [Eubacterium sp.]|jgi:phosphopantothenoylcysteine decarboxylase/phosphopantothenate--cysteine ligase|nr:bifunctional phosphopantothenoylcysteine decarboxylase/phosphopantothenate--cysteine ligase CoaBC [Eubacterium sp.]
MLKGKTVVLGVTGSIAAYKMANLTSMLIKLHCDVHVIMTKNATNIINPITFETLTGHKCLVDTFDRNFNYNIEHVALGDKADLMLVAPASANVIGKLAGGIADDMLTTTALACRCRKLVAPAMNTNMYENPIVQHNLQRLREFGMEVIEPDTGILACKAVGKGKLPSEEILLEYILREIHLEKDLEGKKVLVTAGATREAIDPVRFITNHSTGKMGYALAKVAMYRGAEVTLVSAPTQLQPPICVKLVRVESAEDMFREVKKLAPDMDIIIKAAAVADFTPVEYHEGKIKKKEGESTLELKRTQDILAYLGARRRQGQYICGFSMETENMIENSQQKLKDKHVDLIVANNLNTEGAGFASDTNIVTLIMEEGLVELPCMSKEEVAATIFDVIVKK